MGLFFIVSFSHSARPHSTVILTLVTQQSICYAQFDDTGWKQIKQPVRFGGIGLRSANDLTTPAYLSSRQYFRRLVSTILSPPSEPRVENTDDVITSHTLNIPDDHVRQSHWDSLLCFAKVAVLKRILNQYRLACFVAATCKESGAWLKCLPSTAIGCQLDNDSFLLVSIRLRLLVCTPHCCRCGSRVDEYGLHQLSCRYNIGCLHRHSLERCLPSLSLICRHSSAIRTRWIRSRRRQ